MMIVESLEVITPSQFWEVQGSALICVPKPKLSIRPLRVLEFARVMDVALPALEAAPGPNLAATTLSRRYKHLVSKLYAVEKLIYFFVLRWLGVDMEALAKRLNEVQAG